MGIANFFGKTVVISRLRDVSGTNKRAYQATATADGAIQLGSRSGGNVRVASGFVSERIWIAYFDIETNIIEGDLITDSTGKRYKVVEATLKNYGINEHLEVGMSEYDD